uniref:Uncharacterized protein n=1 Tax=Arundo donax TaxID=35708 RepID=A0A0A8YNG7_ARUDO
MTHINVDYLHLFIHSQFPNGIRNLGSRLVAKATAIWDSSICIDSQNRQALGHLNN